MAVIQPTVFLFLFWIRYTSATTVETTHGKVEGTESTLSNGKVINAYLGIPYAAPPLGEYRYAPPQPVQPWTETLQAKNMSKGCVQAVSDKEKAKWFISDLPESEDCLYLNIWTPSNSKEEKLPVMIWILPGGFFAGTSKLDVYDGGILASEQNIIVASMNFRLTQFGFLFLNSAEVSGNAGLQDQIQAIRWIKDNIENFGGDPNKITLFGESAGSMACGFHLTNMNIQDLFQNVIMESGPIGMPLITHSEEEALNTSLTLIQNVNCMRSDVSESLKCLRSKSVDELMANYYKIPDYLLIVFVPLRNGVEVPISINTIVDEIPDNKRKNLLGGTIPGEIIYFMEYTFPGKVLNEDTIISENDVRTYLEEVYKLKDRTLQDVVIWQYKNFTKNYNVSQVRDMASEITSDGGYICSQLDFMKAWAGTNNKVFVYNFKHRPTFRVKEQIPEWAGAVHGDEVPFSFGVPLNPKYGFTLKERELSKTIMTLWANFAKSGDPNIGTEVNVTWPKLEPNATLKYVDIDDIVATGKTSYQERQCEFWSKVFPGLLEKQNKIGV